MKKCCNISPYLESDHLKNENVLDVTPKDLTCDKIECDNNVMDPELLNSSDSFINDDTSVIKFTFPDIKIITFKMSDFIKELYIEWDYKDMKLDIHYAYSIDDAHTWSRYYSNETEYNKFLTLLNDSYGKEFDVIIKIRFEATLMNESTYNESINNNIFIVDIKKLLVNGNDIEIKHFVLTNSTGINLHSKTQLWDPYSNMDAAHGIQAQVASSVNWMFGHWCYYFKTDPVKTSKNVTLKTYQMFNVVDMKKIKISVPDNNFPGLRDIYSEWGFTLPDQFEVHILCEMFNEAFGRDSFPHTHDYVYFPLTKTLYNVNAYFEHNDFMYKTLYWDCTLVKYEDNKIIDKTGFEEDTKLFEELEPEPEMEELFEDEIEKADPKYLNTKLFEYFREKMNKNIEIVNYQLINKRIKLFDNMYRLTNIQHNDIAVQFDCKHCPMDNINISFWVMFERTTPNKTLLQLINTDSKLISQLNIINKKLQLIYNDIILDSDIELENDIRYGISINISLLYQFMELYIIGYDEDKQEITKILTTNKIDNISTNIYELDKLQILGGKYLLSNIGLDNCTYSIDDTINIISRITPNTKNNILFDKAAVPISDNTIHGY